MAFSLKIRLICLVVVVCSYMVSTSWAKDQIFLKQGPPVKGEIQGFKNNFLDVKLASGQIPVPLTNVKRVELAERPEYLKGTQEAAKGNDQAAIKLLQPLVDKFLGLDVGWVADAAGSLAECQARLGNTYEAEQLVDKILSIYKGGTYEVRGRVIKAQMAFLKGDMKTANELVDKLIEEVSPKDQPIPDEAATRMLSSLIFLKAEIQQKEGKKAEALENYLKVALIFNKPKQRADEAQKRADKLREENNDLIVN